MPFVPLRTVVGTDEEDTGFKPLRDVYLGPAPQRGAIAAGLSAGVDQLQGLGYSALGGVADIAGASGARDWANEQARRNQVDASVGGRPDLERIEDQSLGSALPYLGYQVAKQVPTMLGIAGAQLIPGAGQVAGAVGLTRLGAVAPRMLGGGGLQAGSSAAARRAALAQGEVFGTGTLAGSAMGFGSLYGESVEGGDPSPFKSLALAPIYGAAEAVLPAVLQGSLRAPARYSGNIGTRMAKAGGVAGAGEALTELGQNELEMGMRSDLTAEEMASRRLNAAAAGLIVGGSLGTVGGVRGPRRPDTESDLTQPLDTTTRPDPSQFVTQDQTVGLKKFIDVNTGVVRPSRKDYEKQFEAAFNEPSGQFVADAATGVERELTVGELMQRGSTAMDLTQDKPADTAAAATAATNVATTRDPRDVFLRDELKVIPNNNSRQLFTLMEEQGVDPTSPAMVPVWNYAAAKYMTPSRLTKATELMDAAIIQSRKEAPIGTGISTVQQPAGGVGVGGPVVQGSVGNAGRPAPVAGAMDGSAPAAGAPLQQAGILPVAPGQPSTTVTTGAPSGPQASQTIQTAPQGQTATTVPAAAPVRANTTLRLNQQEKLPGETDITNIADIARMTGNAGGIDAVLEDEAGLRADQRDFTDDDLNAVIEEQVGKGKNADRDRQILRAYITARRAVPSGYKGNIAKEIADSFGIAESRVRQIGNPEKLADIAVSMGFDRAQVFDRLGIQSAQKALATELGKLEGELTRLKAKAKPTKADIARMAELDEQITRINDEVEAGDMAAAFKEAGIEGEAGEAFGNLDDAREWQKASTAGSQMAVKLVSIADTIAELKTAAAELNQLGLAQAEAAAAERIKELTAEYQAIVSGYEAKPEAAAPKKGKGKGKAAEKASEEKDAAKEAEAAKFRAERAAKLQADRNGLAVGDTVKNPKLGTGVVKSFAGDGDATTVTVAFQSGQTKELSVKLAKLEKTDAVQVESPAGVSVQPKAETGEKVGRQVRRAPKPAAEGKAQVPAVILTQAEQAAQAWDVVAADFPEAPKFADLTKAQQNTFIGFGEGNWERGDVELELTKLARAAAPTQRAIRLRHGTTAANKAMIEKLGHMDPEGGERQYTYSEFGRKAVYLTRPEGWWLDKEKAAAGRAVVYDSYVDVELPSDANVVTINNMADFEALAKRVGESSAKSMANKLAVDGLDWLSQAKELRSITLDQAVQKYIREQKESAAKYGGFDTKGVNTLGELADFLNTNVNNQYTQTTEAELRTRIRDNWLDAKSYELDTFGESDAMTQKLIDAGVDVIDIAPDADVGVAADQVVVLRPELVKLASAVKQQEAFLRKSRRSVRTADQSGVEFESVEASLDDLSNYSEGIAAGIRSLRDVDMGNAVDAIDSWMVTFSPVSWDAIYTMIDGKRTIIYNGVILKDKVLSTVATLHEVGHGIDEVQGGAGKFSGGAEFRMSRVNGELMSMRPGTVADELLNHWEDASETSALGGMLNYPLDMTDPENRSLTMQELREEVFAQVWAFSNLNGGMDYLRDNLPTTHAFMEKAHEQVKATNYQRAQGAQQGAQSGQVQAGQQNAQPAGAVLRASRQAKQGLIDRNIAKLPKMSQQPVRNLAGALGDIGGAGLDYVVFTSDLVKRAVAAGLPAAQTFSDRLASRNAKVSEEERKIEKIADRYASIEDDAKGSGPGSVNEFLFESTRTGKWGYGKFRDAKMGAAFDALGPKAQQFVKDVFAHGDATLSNKKKIVLDAANSEYDAMIKAAQDAGDTKTEATLKAEKAATLKRFQTLFRIREGMPYAPIKRTGSYVVIGESAEYQKAKANKDTATLKKLESDPDHYHVSFTDTKWQARSLRDRLAEQGVFTDPQVVSRSESFDEAFSGEAMLPALTKMRAAVDRRAQDSTGKKDPTAGKLLNIINQLYLEALAEGSARKSEMRRRGVAGEVDMLQSFTQQGRADANFLASVEFEPKIQDALQQMRNQSRTGDRERKSEIFDELTKRYAGTLDPQPSPFINGLTNMASKFFLASSPGYYLQNLTQPFMMSLPAMAGRHDYTKAAAELAKAYGELGPLFKDVKLFDEQFDFSKVPADVRKAINELVNQGKIDIGLATEINEYKVEADNKLSKFAQRLNKGMRLAVQKVEATNRLSTAIAAYRLEFARTKDADKATQYAADILTDTHGDYTAFNAPRAFNTQWGKVALQFRKFQLIQIAFYSKLVRDAFTNPAERAAAMKTLAYSLSHTAVFAGMMGLPGYAAISAILGFFGDEDEPYDLTAEMRKALGPEWANIIMRGAPTVVGMDLSGKIGAGNMLSIMPFSDADLSTNAGRAEAFGTLIGGAALGMTSRIIDGLGLIASGDYYKGVERVMPKGVSDALKAARQGAEGMTRRNGDVVLPDSEISSLDTVFTALGVPAVEQTVTYERQNRMRDLTKNFQDRTTRIKNDYAKAVREKDTAAMAEARTAWTKLQQARQRNGLTPQPVSSLLKAPQEQKAREQRTVGGVQYREGQRKLAESVAAD
jgi:hypothetical protein